MLVSKISITTLAYIIQYLYRLSSFISIFLSHHHSLAAKKVNMLVSEIWITTLAYLSCIYYTISLSVKFIHFYLSISSSNYNISNHIILFVSRYIQPRAVSPSGDPRRSSGSIDNFCALDPTQKPINTLTKRKIWAKFENSHTQIGSKKIFTS